MAIAGHENLNGMMEGLPPQPPLAGIFNLKAVLTQGELIEAKSGFSPDKYANTAVGGKSNSDPESEEEKKKKERNEQHYRAMSISMQSFTFKGIEISFDKAMKHIDTITSRCSEQRKENLESAEIEPTQIARWPDGTQVQTIEELDQWYKTQPMMINKAHFLSVDQITIVDGKFVNAKRFYGSIEANEEMAEIEQKLEEARKLMEEGKMDQISDDAKELLVQAETGTLDLPTQENSNPDGFQYVSPAQVTITESFNNNDLNMPFIVEATPTEAAPSSTDAPMVPLREEQPPTPQAATLKVLSPF